MAFLYVQVRTAAPFCGLLVKGGGGEGRGGVQHLSVSLIPLLLTHLHPLHQLHLLPWETASSSDSTWKDVSKHKAPKTSNLSCHVMLFQACSKNKIKKTKKKVCQRCHMTDVLAFPEPRHNSSMTFAHGTL